MKKVSLLILVSMILLLAFTSCDQLPDSVNDKINEVLGMVGVKQPEPEHEHEWADATCESPKTCECGETEGEALGHNWSEATCESPKTCSVCKKSEGNALKHEWVEADCVKPTTCKLCGSISGGPKGHAWVEGDCEHAKHCAICNTVEGTAPGHDWAEATCTTPKTCKTCGETEGVAADHSWTAADCDSARTCSVCGLADGEALGHTWMDATCVLPEICKVCGTTQGEALGHDMADATCTAPKTCKHGCGLTEGSALGHTITDTVVAPSCTEQGFTAHTCSVCGNIESDTYVEPTGHSWIDATCVSPKTCENCGLTEGSDPSGHDYVDATCTTPKTCKLCGGTEGEALGHTGGTATCNALAKCDVCGEGYGEYGAHAIDLIVDGDSISYECHICSVSFAVEDALYYDGTSTDYKFAANGGATMTPNAGAYDVLYTGDPHNDRGVQHMLWVPTNGATSSLTSFTCDNNSTGVVSFRMKSSATEGFTVAVAKTRGSKQWDAWNTSSINLFYVNAVTEGATSVTLKGGLDCSTEFTTVNVVDGWTEWFEVTIFISLKDDKTLTANYFVNDVYYGEFSRDLANPEGKYTINSFDIQALYINGWTATKGTGYVIDDIVFGCTTDSHYVFDNQAHVVTPATCTEPETCSCGVTRGEALGHDMADATCTAPKTCKACGATEGTALGHDLELSYTEEAATLACHCGATLVLDEYREWDGEGEDGKVAHSPNGKVDSVKEDGAWGFIFNPATEVAPGEGWYEYPGSGGHYGAQIQPWIPSNNRADCLAGFSCENNAVGVISFDIKYNMTRHENRDTNFQLGVGKPRNASNWGDGGSWTDDQITILCIDDYSEDGILVRGGVNSSINLATIAVKDGWSEWFNVTIAIEMLDTGYMNTYYYINGVFCGSYSRDLSKADADGRLLNPKEIEAFQFSGWTYAANTGVMFDNMVFGYTAGGHNMLTGEAHDRLAATCTEPERCSCGFVYGPALGHDATEATCLEAGVCNRCGETVGDPLGHDLSHSLVEDELSISCANCGETYVLDEYKYMNGASKNDFVFSKNGAFDLSVNENGEYVALFAPEQTEVPNASDFTQDANGKPTGTYKGWAYYNAPGAQHMFWIPSNGAGKGLTTFDCMTNSAGVIAFRMKTNVTNAFNVSGAKERGLPNGTDPETNWTGWGGAEVKLLNVGGYSENGIVLKGGIGAGTELTTIAVKDGWSEWFDVKIFITLKDDKTITAHYYIDGVYYGAFTAAMPVDSLDIRVLYINGWTYAANTGIMIDDIVMGCTENGHLKFDDQAHEKLAATCTEPERCTCGYVYAPALGHDAKATCTEDGVCSRCGETTVKALGHDLGASNWIPEINTFVYSCANGCGATYKLTGYYADGTNTDNLVVVNNNDGQYALKINEAGQYEMLYPHETSTNTLELGKTPQQQIWVPLMGNPELMFDFSCANNAVGFLSFKVSGYNDLQNIQFKLNADRGTSAWDWGKTSFAALDITPVKSDSQKTVDVLAYGNHVIKTVEIGEDKFTPWLDVAIKVELHDDNTMTLTYYLDGVEVYTVTTAMPITTGRITSVYINGRTSVKDSGFKFDDLVFGYVAPEKFYNKEVAADKVASATLKTIVNGKFKQCDQCTAINTDGGTPVYVLAEKDGKAVEALYVSRTTPWDESPKEHFTEFRFAVNGEQKGFFATGLSFDYKIKGTVEKNERYEFTDLKGNKFFADAYVQIKTAAKHELAGDNYPELSGTDLILDGEWHTMNVDFGETVEIIDILLNLYHFQGELLIANLELKTPFYNSEITAENVTSDSLKTIVDSKFKQCDQCTEVNKQGGTPEYVLAAKDFGLVEALYVSRTYAWAGNEAEQFTEFRFDVDGSKKATKISFDYKIEGTVETNDRYTFKDLAGNEFKADAYVQIKTPANHPLAGDSYPELSGTDLVLDGEWHTMTYTFAEPLEIINILLNLYHFEGEMLISNLVVEFEA